MFESLEVMKENVIRKLKDTLGYEKCINEWIKHKYMSIDSDCCSFEGDTIKLFYLQVIVLIYLFF